VYDRLMIVAESRFFRPGIVKGLSSGPLSERIGVFANYVTQRIKSQIRNKEQLSSLLV
jgi:hypothetical protein